MQMATWFPEDMRAPHGLILITSTFSSYFSLYMLPVFSQEGYDHSHNAFIHQIKDFGIMGID